MDFEFILDKLGIRERRLFAVNQTDYDETITACVADWPADKLRQLPRCPHYRRFYTEDLMHKVADKYKDDIAMFGYDF